MKRITQNARQTLYALIFAFILALAGLGFIGNNVLANESAQSNLYLPVLCKYCQLPASGTVPGGN